MINKNRTILLLLIGTFQVYGHIVIDPSKPLDIQAKPGEIKKGFYTITNSDSHPIIVNVQSQESFSWKENKDYKIEDWFRLSPKTLRVGPQQSGEMEYTIIAPNDAEGFLSVKNRFSHQKLDSQGKIQPQSVNLAFTFAIYLRIEGKQNISAIIDSVKIARTGENLDAMVGVKNLGNTYLRLQGFVDFIKEDNLLRRISLKEAWPVFPEKVGTFKGTTNFFELPEGQYSTVTEIRSKETGFKTKKKQNFFLKSDGTFVRNPSKTQGNSP